MNTKRHSILGALAAVLAGLVVVSVAAAAPPFVTTGAASSIAPTRVRLNASVDPRGSATTWYFQLGTTTGYGTDTAVQSAGAGTKAVQESIVVAGLAAGTTYDFRVVASNGSGTTFGANQAFVTPGPPEAATQTSESVGTTTATLMGTLDPGGLSTSWYFQYGTSTAYGSTTPTENIGSGTATLPVSAPLSSLTAGTTYHFRLVAVSSAGTSYGADASFSTSPALTLKTQAQLVVHGNDVALTGAVADAGAGVMVTVAAEPYGTSAFATVGTTLTRTDGTYLFYARPHIGTTYEASGNGGSSQTVAVAVRPSVSLVRLTRGRLESHVAAGVQLVHRQVKLQRLQHGKWVTLEQLHLNTSSNAVFGPAALPHGHSTIRVALSVNEAGPGLLAGFSRVIAYSRA
jgi:hypothetical protein